MRGFDLQLGCNEHVIILNDIETDTGAGYMQAQLL